MIVFWVMKTVQNSFGHPELEKPMDEKRKGALKLSFQDRLSIIFEMRLSEVAEQR